MARASTPTLLSLDRWAEIMNLNPVHFNGASGDVVWPDEGHSCKDIWPQHSWQSPDIISREELARQIRQAEQSIARALGYWPAPTWIAAEEHNFPSYFNRGWEPTYSAPRMINTKYRHVIAGGRRATSEMVLDAEVVYSDNDGDGFNELATIVVPDNEEDLREVKVFFGNKSARPEWEIRPIKSITRSGGNITIVMDSWLFISPILWEKHPTSMQLEPVNITTTANYVASADVYRVYNSATEAAATFYNSTGFYCQTCSNAGCVNCSQSACLKVDNGEYGRVLPSAAEYDEDSATWIPARCNPLIDASTLKVWYYSGYQSEDYKSGLSYDPLDDMLAQAITYLATARLSKPVCSCSNVRLMADDLRRDFAFSDKNSFNLVWRSGVVQTNPFGTKAGEVRAWKIVNEIIGDAVIGGVM